MSRWILLVALLIVGCAPTTEFRIERRTTPLAPGRLLVVPVGAHPRLAGIGRRDSVHVRAGFESAQAHEVAFWEAFVGSIGRTLPGFDATLGAPMDSAAFVARRALVQGVQPGYGRDRWTVEPILMPVTIDSSLAQTTDYVLYVRNARMTTDVKNNESALGAGFVAAGGALGGAIGGAVVSVLLPTKGFGAGADIVMVSASTGEPVVVLGIAGAEGGDGVLGTRLNQDVWRRAMHQLTLSLAARTGVRAR